MSDKTGRVGFDWALLIRDDREEHLHTRADSKATGIGDPDTKCELRVPPKYWRNAKQFGLLLRPSCTTWDASPPNNRTGRGGRATISDPEDLPKWVSMVDGAILFDLPRWWHRFSPRRMQVRVTATAWCEDTNQFVRSTATVRFRDKPLTETPASVAWFALFLLFIQTVVAVVRLIREW